MKLNLNFLGGGGDAKQITSHGVSMDIFWNCTILVLIGHTLYCKVVQTSAILDFLLKTQSIGIYNVSKHFFKVLRNELKTQVSFSTFNSSK